MLDAIVHKKLRGYLREIVRDNRELHRSLQEDVITSAVFGPLQYMPTSTAWDAVKKTLLSGVPGLDSFKPSKHKLIFWPSLHLPTGIRVEPDLIFEFEKENENEPLMLVLLEVKWNAPLSENQLRDQRNAIEQQYSERLVKIHQVFLAKNVGTEDAQTQVKDVECHSVTWYEVASTVKLFISGNGWGDQVRSFLTYLGEVPFDGFYLNVPSIDKQAVEAAFDWRPDGWAFAVASTEVCIDSTSTYSVINWNICS